MTISKEITPKYIQKFLEDEEIPLRCRTFPPHTVKAIFRYGAIVGHTIEHQEQMERGMECARQLIRRAEEKNLSFPSGTVIIADVMMQSRGRFKRSWHAPRGGLWMTLALVNTLLPESSLLLPMAAGVASCEVLRAYGVAAHLKWVNDVLVDNKKIAGILTESFTGPRFGEEYILIGIGINVNNDRFPVELSRRATSVKSCCHKDINLPEMTARLLAKLRWNIGLLFYEEALHLEAHGGIARDHFQQAENAVAHEHQLLKSYKGLTDIFNRRVLFGYDVEKSPLFEARVVGLDNTGGLILEMDDSSRVIQHTGEIIYLD